MSPVKLPTVMSRTSTTHFWHFATYSSAFFLRFFYVSLRFSTYLISRIIRRICRRIRRSLRRRIRRMRELTKREIVLAKSEKKIAAAKI